MVYYSAIKKEILSFATTLMTLEGIMVSEINQRENDKTAENGISFTWNLKRKADFTETIEWWFPGFRGWRKWGKLS